jgi:calnexin
VTVTGATAFLETFTSGDLGAWSSASDEKYAGVATVVKADGTEDDGLYVTEAARHYGYSAPLAAPFDPSGGLTLQYEVALQDGLECGGAYLKFLTAGDGPHDAAGLNGDSPYTVMFGPDKCGGTNKVHVIFRHKAPDGTIEEKHLTAPPAVPFDRLPHLYTLVVNPDNTFEVKVDGETQSEGSLFDSFEPPFNPPETIDDPEDSKPTDWIDSPKMEDPEASKPDDWDEDAPMQIDDMDAVKPTGMARRRTGRGRRPGRGETRRLGRRGRRRLGSAAGAQPAVYRREPGMRRVDPPQNSQPRLQGQVVPAHGR